MNISMKFQQTDGNPKSQMAIEEIKNDCIGDEEFLCQAHHQI